MNTWNPLDKNEYIVLTNGNRTAHSTIVAWSAVRADVGIEAATANNYFEVEVGASASWDNVMFGVSKVAAGTGEIYYSQYAWLYWNNGTKWNNASNTAYGATGFAAGDIMGLLLKEGKIYIRRNGGAWMNSGDPSAGTGFMYSGITGIVYPTLLPYEGNSNSKTGTVRLTSAEISSLPSGAVPWGGIYTLNQTFQLVSPSGAPLASTAVEYAVFLGAKPNSISEIVHKGAATTNSSGELVLSLTPTTIANASVASILISTTNGTPGAACKSHYTPFTAVVTMS